MEILKALLFLALIMGAGLGALKLTHPLPDRSGVQAGVAMPPRPDTRLGAAILAHMAAHPGLSRTLNSETWRFDRQILPSNTRFQRLRVEFPRLSVEPLIELCLSFIGKISELKAKSHT